MKLIVLAVLILGSSWCLACEDEDRLAWIEHSEPIRDAQDRYAAGNYKFAAVRGFSLMVSGVDQGQGEILGVGKYFVIEGTGDDLCSRRHADLNKRAYEYAEQYNRVLARLIAGT